MANEEKIDDAPPTLKDGSGEYTSPIFQHRLTYAKWVPDSDVGRDMPAPTIIVAHYTVSQSGAGVVATFGARDSLSCHLTNFPDGTCVQMVPFDRTAAHAGKSSWEGRSGCNAFSVGIELVNPGPVFLRQGKYFDVNGQEWTGDVLEAHHQNPSCGWRTWAEYTDEQVDMFIRQCSDLMAYYPSIRDVVGHEDVAPGRKLDPGPAFPWGAIRSALRLPERAA